MGTVASELKSEREKRKISLAHIAAETHISLRHLQSLEEGRFNDLPGGIYNKAFLKAYCETLNLNNLQEIMQRYENELSPTSEKPLKSRVHVPQQSRSFRISPLLIWGLMLLVSATGLFFSRKWISAVFSPYFSHTPASPVRYESVQPKTVPNTPAATPNAEPAAQNSSPAGVSTEPAIVAQGPSLPSEPAAAEPQTQSAVESKSATPLPPTSTAQQPLRLEINATEKCWVSIDKDGSPAYRKTMEPGEVQVLTAAETFRIILGNAGGVHLKINGKPAKQLGKPGQVMKFLIDGKNLQDILDPTAG